MESLPEVGICADCGEEYRPTCMGARDDLRFFMEGVCDSCANEYLKSVVTWDD